MRVLDLNAATSYYSELMARVVGSSGHVIAHNHSGALAMMGQEALTGRYLDFVQVQLAALGEQARQSQADIATLTVAATLIGTIQPPSYLSALVGVECPLFVAAAAPAIYFPPSAQHFGQFHP
jgi:protein-L-isoaspartate O-methyltransferase